MSIYKSYTPDQVDNLLSNFLVTSWSYSKLSQFARNEKAFEMRYIYNIKGKSSATTIAGTAYHEGLKHYFSQKQQGIILDLPEIERVAFSYIEDTPANYWKCQKTTPTVEEARQKAYTITTALLRNFFSEIGTYIDQIKEIIHVEIKCAEWLVINGVDIPMPCHGQIDLVVQTIDDKIVILDHKSKTIFSDEEELKLSIGIQAITYVNLYETATGYQVDEVWFMENKISQNKDKSPQINAFKVKIDKDVRRLYEALLYEPLKRMLEAVQNPDYVYLINESDNFIDKSEIYEFWAKTMLAEIEEFDIEPSKRELIEKRRKKIRDASVAAVNPKVIKEFQKNAAEFIQYDLSNKDMTQEQKIEHILRSFGIIVKVAFKFDGFSSNTYLVEVSAGTKITSIHSHKLDIANALDVAAVRIPTNLTVHDGKSYVTIEFVKKRDKDLNFDPSALVGRKIPLGKDNFDKVVYWDLDNHSTPHVLMCGATGSGKSVEIRNIIDYALLTEIDKVVIFDPKYEFMGYGKIAKVEVYNEIIAIEEEMAKLVEQMNIHVKNNTKTKTLVIFDEFADAVSASRKGKQLDIIESVQVGTYAPKKGFMGIPMPPEPKMAMKKTGELKSLEENLRVLVQKGRSVGYRVVAATQRASVQVITGDAKVNFPVQICFRVPKEADSRVVLDEPGAESLAGRGDGLIKSPEYENITRFQAYYKA